MGLDGARHADGQGPERRERAEAAVGLIATGAARDLSELRRLEGTRLASVELVQIGEGDVDEVEVQPHTDGVGGDHVIDLARLVHRDLGVARARRERAEDHRHPTTPSLEPLRDFVHTRHAESHHGRARRKLPNPRCAQGRQA